tara:strand:- start:1537 stop:1809 length:273 start_codon:yes stop_codon:yes gene_type:complete
MFFSKILGKFDINNLQKLFNFLIERVAVFITHPFQRVLKLKRSNCAFSQLLDKHSGSMTAVAINRNTSTEPPSFGYVRENNNSGENLLAM